MPEHLQTHWDMGRTIWGLFWLRPNVNIGQLAEELVLIWETSDAEEWIDRLEWMPL